MKPLGDVALGEYGPKELWDAAWDTRTCIELEFEYGREETALEFEAFARTLEEIRGLSE